MERFFHKEWTGLNETLANAVDTTSSFWNEWAGVGQSVQTFSSTFKAQAQQYVLE